MRPTDIEVPADGSLQQTVYVFRYESSWCGRRDQTFPTHEKAEEAWIAQVTADPQQRTYLLELRRSNERAFLERMDELRDPMDNFCIFAQDFGVTMPTATPPAVSPEATAAASPEESDTSTSPSPAATP